MSVSQFVFDVSRENFQEIVIQNSQKGPVLVNYWTAKAGPCLRLWPILEKLANEYAGKFLLVNLNTDKEGALAREHGVNSVPSVKLYFKEQIVEQIHGVESVDTFKKMLDRYVSRDSDIDLANAVRQYQDGNVEQCFASMEQLLILDPENLRILTTYAKLLMREQHYRQAHDALEKHMSRDATEEMKFLSANALIIATAEEHPAIEVVNLAIEKNENDTDSLKRNGLP